MATINEAYKNIADVNLWLRDRSGDKLNLSDIPSIIPLRWQYFKESWEFIKPNIIRSLSTSPNPDFLNEQINDFSSFIESQRNNGGRLNPFQDANTFYRFYMIFDSIRIQGINLTNEEKRIIDQELARIRGFSKNNFVSAKQSIIDYRDRVTDTYGLSVLVITLHLVRVLFHHKLMLL